MTTIVETPFCVSVCVWATNGALKGVELYDVMQINAPSPNPSDQTMRKANGTKRPQTLCK